MFESIHISLKIGIKHFVTVCAYVPLEDPLYLEMREISVFLIFT